MSATAERMYALCKILEYLRASPRARSIEDIHLYLLENSDWGRSQLARGTGDLGKQNMEKWIRSMHDSDEFCEEIEWDADPENKKRNLYRARQKPGKKKVMPIEEACFLGLAEKFLDVVLPTTIDASMHERFVEAKAELRRYANSEDQNKKAINAYVNRIDALPRGQELFRKKLPYEVIKEISKAILQGKCVRFKYRGSPRYTTYHPYGIVIREPKIYLIAVKDEEMKRNGSENCRKIQLPPSSTACRRSLKPGNSSGMAEWRWKYPNWKDWRSAALPSS